jgi:hypothetical protein
MSESEIIKKTIATCIDETKAETSALTQNGLKELQEYRRIGSVEYCKKLSKLVGKNGIPDSIPAYTEKILREYPRYMTLGSIEDCQIAIKKREQKKVVEKCKNVNFGTWKEWYCPDCGEKICDSGRFEENRFCKHCGSGLSWEGVRK